MLMLRNIWEEERLPEAEMEFTRESVYSCAN